MSRIKSSSSVHGSYKYEVTQKSTAKPPWFEPTVVDKSRDVLGFTRRVVPKVKINPKQVDGYRSPSSYYMQTQSVLGTGPYHEDNALVPATISAKPVIQKFPYSEIESVLSGDTVVRLQPAAYGSTWALEQEVRMKVLNNIKDEAFDAAMILAEIGKTANTAANLMLRIGRSMNAISRRSPESFNWLMHGKMGTDNRRPSEKFLKETASIFLEWKYGIMPSVYDLEGITKTLDMQQDGSLFDNPPLMVARSHVSRTEQLKCGYVITRPFSDLQHHSCDLKTTISARADFAVSGDGMRTLSKYGIGLTSVATIAYDLTPFSFVANMVVPMAEIISAWGALAGVTLKGYSETTYRKYTFPSRTLVGKVDAFENVIVRTKPGTLTSFTRSGGTSIPMPLPFIRNPVKVGNVSTVLALFTQMRGRPKS